MMVGAEFILLRSTKSERRALALDILLFLVWGFWTALMALSAPQYFL